MLISLSFRVFLHFLMSQWSLVYVYGGDFIPERTCGTLYSENDFQGDSFTLNDFDFSADTRKDYRNSLSGWLNTSSVRVEKECSMYVCSEKYFKGVCTLLNHNISQPGSLISQIGSANCTCARKCSCENVIVSRQWYGRAYLKGGCQLCDTNYFQLSESHSQFRLSQNVEIVKLRKGCNLTVYNDDHFNNISSVYSTEFIQSNFSTFKSYQFSCNNNAYTPPLKSPFITDPQKIRIPETSQGLLQLASTNDVMTNHPGIKSSLKSLQSGRSSRNAYILLLGMNSEDNILDTVVCGRADDAKIRECHISVPLDNLGITNSQVRLIYYGGSFKSSNEDDDYICMASLDEYLSNHEELNHTIPNTVVLYLDISDGENVDGQYLRLQRLLRILHSLRERVLDESYSNVILYLYTGNYPDTQIVDNRITTFEISISSKWAFPKPTLIIQRSGKFYPSYRKLVNGFEKMNTGEYFPVNLVHRLRVVCRGSGDPLGEAIFNQMYVETGKGAIYTTSSTALLSKNHTLVDYYRQRHQPESVSILPDENTVLKNSPILSANNQSTSDERILKLEEELAKIKEEMGSDSERITNQTKEYIRVEHGLFSGNINSQMQQLVGKLVNITNLLKKQSGDIQALQNLLKLSDERQNRCVEENIDSKSRIQILEVELTESALVSEKLATRLEQLEEQFSSQINSRDVELGRTKNELLDILKRELNNLLYAMA